MELSNEILSNITVYMKYAKYIPELNRRESWYELVTRNMDMNIKKSKFEFTTEREGAAPPTLLGCGARTPVGTR